MTAKLLAIGVLTLLGSLSQAAAVTLTDYGLNVAVNNGSEQGGQSGPAPRSFTLTTNTVNGVGAPLQLSGTATADVLPSPSMTVSASINGAGGSNVATAFIQYYLM